MRFSIFGRSSGVSFGQIEVVVEAVLDRRAEAELGAGTELEHRCAMTCASECRMQ